MVIDIGEKMFLNTYTLQWNLSGGFQGNEYDVEISLGSLADDVEYPSGGLLDSAISATGIGGDISPKINILCKQITLPGKSLSTSEYFHQGRKYIVTAEDEYTNSIEIEYYNDRELTTRRFFMNWLDEISASEKNVYDASIIITPKTKKALVDIAGATNLEHKFMAIYPTAISDLALDGTNTSDLTTTTVTLAYSYLDSEETAGGLLEALAGLF